MLTGIYVRTYLSHMFTQTSYFPVVDFQSFDFSLMLSISSDSWDLPHDWNFPQLSERVQQKNLLASHGAGNAAWVGYTPPDCWEAWDDWDYLMDAAENILVQHILHNGGNHVATSTLKHVYDKFPRLKSAIYKYTKT